MDKIEFDKYTEAVDLVCLNCTAPTLDYPEVCDSCPVRKSVDYYRKTAMTRIEIAEQNFIKVRDVLSASLDLGQAYRNCWKKPRKFYHQNTVEEAIEILIEEAK